MELESCSETISLSPQDHILTRLHQYGIGEDKLIQLQPGLVDYLKENRPMVADVVNAILPSNHDLADDAEFHECFNWLQWLMFESDPLHSLNTLSTKSVNQRGVCGAVWGHNDIAYRCRTCEHDPTCAICVPCFQNGNHKDHDYSLMYTGGGCCDCGDIDAWKRDGFCSHHKGAEQIQPLSQETANSAGPVLDAIFIYWKQKLLFTQTAMAAHSTTADGNGVHIKVANDLTSTIVEMLLEFCKFSESLLGFVSKRVSSSVGLLDVLVRAERFLSKGVVKKLHELLLKLLGEPTFKYEFAKVFIKHYPDTIKEAIKESSDNILEKYPLLSTFSVQIFTVPTLTPILVKEMNLLDILIGCVVDIFDNCLAEEGHIEVDRWASLYETTIRLIEDTRYVMNHAEVPKYITHEQPDISRTWIRLLAFVQGMNPQKRVTVIHVEEENEHTHMPFVLGNSIANIHTSLVAGAILDWSMDDIDDIDDRDGLFHAKAGKFSQESSVCSTSGRSYGSNGKVHRDVENFESGNHLPVSSSMKWLICECLRALENWLRFNSVSKDPQDFLSQDTCRMGSNFLALKKTISRISKGKGVSKAFRTVAKARPSVSSEFHGRLGPLPNHSGDDMCIDLARGQRVETENTGLIGISDMDVECANTSRGADECPLETCCGSGLETLGVLSLSDWPDISYDVSSQDISVHIPLHRLLAMLLQKVLSVCYGESKALDTINSVSNFPSSGCSRDFFGWILGGCHPVGFSAFLMEHPLRIRVFYAQVRAGMWRKNGEAAILSCEWYRSVRWSGQGLELDLFLLQCCGALAPPDLYVKRILDRFGLSHYLSMSLEQSNEYEPILVQEMLTLIIQIVKERRFCGNSTSETLQRELIYKLAVGDATRSQLVKSLPHDLSKNKQLQDILDTVAVYANPSEIKQGKYSLRESYWKELDLYHPRWNSRDLQIAEERYLRFCKVSVLNVQLPRWTNVFPPLIGIAKIATCRAVLEIVRAVLFYAVRTDKPYSSRAPDGVLITALHLLSLALDICHVQRNSSDQLCSTSRSVEDPLPVIAFASEEVDIGATNRSDACRPQSLLSLLVSLMARHKIESVNNFLEAGQSDIYSMIASLLKKFAELDFGCMTKLKTLTPEVISHLLPPSSNGNIHSSSTSDVQDHKAKARERQAAILEKMRAAQFKFMANLKSTSNVEVDNSLSKQDAYMSDEEYISEEPLVCSLCRDSNSNSPVSFMVLLQKSQLVSFVERGPPSWERVYTLDKERKAKNKKEVTDLFGRNVLSCASETISSTHLVQLVQSAVDKFSNDALPEEVEAFLDFIKARLPVARYIKHPSTSRDRSINTYSIEMLEDNIYQSIQKDMQYILPHSNFLKGLPNNSKLMAEKSLDNDQYVESVLLGKYVATLSRETSEQPPITKIARNENASSKVCSRVASFDGFGPANCDGIHISSCGHAVHQECRDRYLSSLRERYNRRIVYEGGQVVDPEQGEFLCPVCRRLANSVLPMLPGEYIKDRKKMMSCDGSSETGIKFSTISGTRVLHLAKALSLLRSAASMVGKGEILKVISLLQNERMQPNLEPVFQRLCRMYFPDRCDKFIESGRVSHSMIIWDTLKYSLISTEIAARGIKSTLSSAGSVSGIGTLYQELESSSGFILSLLLQIVQSTQSENCLQLLLRFRSIKLFKESICSGVSLDQSSSDTHNQQGFISSVLKHADGGIAYPDIQFWKRAADPILAEDPFSSLMWILFSLPRPFLTSADSFLSLVHLLYVVCIIQALITCCGHNQLDVSKLGYDAFLIGEICKFKGESVAAQNYFLSHYIDSSYHPRDIIRMLCHPFLRRCELLWRLLKSSMSAPFCRRSHQWDVSSLDIGNDILQSTTSISVELGEVEELESLFQIPDLESILMDKELHAVTLKWLHHFSKESEERKHGRVLHLSPAVPFRLMQLPHIYQDLLERYIKQKCPECKNISPDPALCLLCGRLCSPSWKSCCRESGCHAHAMSCGAGIGVFLLIKKTTILLQRSARYAPWPSPYLDVFGEEDIDMQRGKPLYLNAARYAALTRMVARHGLDQSSEVLRQTTIDSFFLI